MLWFVGDYASFDPRNQKVTQIFATLLHEAGVDFGILYDGESNAGNDVRRVGEEGLYEVLADRQRQRARRAPRSRPSSPPTRIPSTPSAMNTPTSAASTRSSTTRRCC